MKYFFNRIKITIYCLLFAIFIIVLLCMPILTNDKFNNYIYYKIYGEEPCAHEWQYTSDAYKGYLIYCPVCDTNQYVSFARYRTMKYNNEIR